MILTKEKIDKISTTWDNEIITLESLLSNSNVKIFIDQETLKYLLLKFCELRYELDSTLENSFGEDL